MTEETWIGHVFSTCLHVAKYGKEADTNSG